MTIDTHTTNGSHHRYALTYEGPEEPGGRPLGPITYSRDTGSSPTVTAVIPRSSDRPSMPSSTATSRPTTPAGPPIPSTPRFGTTYIGLRNRLSVLTEAYSYAPYDVRVWATRDFCRLACEFAAAHREPIRALLAAADRATTDAPHPAVAIRAKPRALPDKVAILGFVERREGNRSVSTGEPKDYPCAVEGDFEPTVTIPRPTAYLVPANLTRAVDLLQAHGVRMTRLEAPERRTVAIDRVAALTRSGRRFEGHNLVEITATTPRTEAREIPAGTWVVPTAQPLGTLAAYLLEPRSDDGLATWNFLDDQIGPDRDFPIMRGD